MVEAHADQPSDFICSFTQNVPRTIKLVSLATSWGPKFGGINAFNIEFVRSLNLPDRVYQLICVVPFADEHDIEDARRHGVILRHLGIAPGAEMTPDRAGSVAALVAGIEASTTIWIGHDDKTGPLAIALRRIEADDRTVLIHHMSFGAYQDFKKGDSASAEDKRLFQRELFLQADLCFAVGPMLRDHLHDLFGSSPSAPPVCMLIPGLAQPDPEYVTPRADAPRNFTVFLGGRLGGGDEPIKQPMLGVRGFARAVSKASSTDYTNHAIRRSPCLRMRGVDEPQHSDIRKAFVSAADGKVINFDLQGYTEDRNKYFSDLCGSSVALMPSWHEGFGLVAWEAIACRVPVILGDQSGVYRLLNEELLGMGLQRNVHAIQIQGRIAEDDGLPHTEDDATALGDALLLVGNRIEQCKAHAVQFERQLRNALNYTWERCATDAVVEIQQSLGLAMTRQVSQEYVELVATTSIAAPSGIPDFLRIPPSESRTALQNAAPSTLLLARSQVVRFAPSREPVLNDWLAKLQDDNLPQISFRLVVGPGGSGKTRSALEFLLRVAEQYGDEWTALWMPGVLPSDALAQWNRYLCSKPGRLLLVIDYAEGKQGTFLEWLDAASGAAELDSSTKTMQLHVIGLARSGEWWANLDKAEGVTGRSASLIRGLGNLGVSQLPPLPDQSTAREDAFNSALRDYADAMNKALPLHAWQPRLDEIPYDRPLYIHLAALAALAGERPAHAYALLEAQLRREFVHWAYRFNRFPIRPEYYAGWATTSAWLSLTQGAEQSVFLGAMTELRMSAEIAHSFCLVDASRIAGLQPDLLAEALIVQELGSTSGLSLLESALRLDEESLTRVLETLARLGQRRDANINSENLHNATNWTSIVVDALKNAWPLHSQKYISSAHELGIGLATWLTRAWQRLPGEVQENISKSLVLPRYSIPLLELSVEVSRAKLRAANSPIEVVEALNRLSVRLRQKGGQIAEALDLARRAVEIARRFDDATKAEHWTILANATKNLATCLAKSGGSKYKAEAIQLARENLAIVRVLEKERAGNFLANVALALDSLAKLLSGKMDGSSINESVLLAREALLVFRPIAQADPDSHSPFLAALLTSLSERLAKQGDNSAIAESVLLAREAVSIRRRLSLKQPAAYESVLANSLCSLASRLAEVPGGESNGEAIEKAEEAVAIRRRLSTQHWSAYARPLSAALNNLADKYFRASDSASRIKAISLSREAIEINRNTLDRQSGDSLRQLAFSLDRLVSYLAQGQTAPRNETVELSRELRTIRREIAMLATS